MMDLRIDQDQDDVRAVARRVGEEVLAPRAAEVEADGRVGDALWRRIDDTGMTQIPDGLTALVAIEELARGDVALALGASARSALAVLSDLLGSASGTVPAESSAVALYEGHGRQPGEWATTITRAEGDTWAVRGAKTAVTGATGAERILLFGRDPDHDVVRAVLLGPDDVELAPWSNGQLALEATPWSDLRVATSVPSAQLVGATDPNVVARYVSRLRLEPAAASIGCAARAMTYAARYASERVAFGQPLSAFQGVSFLVAEGEVQLAACRLDLWSCASELQVLDVASLEQQVTRTVGYVTATCAGIARNALQILGGHGFIRDHPVERWYRTTAALSTLDFDPTSVGFVPAL